MSKASKAGVKLILFFCRVDTCFTFQYYGGKEVMGRSGFDAHMKLIETLFDVAGITDGNNKLLANAIFIQDIALTIR